MRDRHLANTGRICSLAALVALASVGVPLAACSNEFDRPSRTPAKLDAGSERDAKREAEHTGSDVRDATPGGSIRSSLCARMREPRDAVETLFCGDVPPRIASLHDLQEQLNLVPYEPKDAPGPDANQPVLLSHSTALSGRLVSPINPRAFVVGETTIMAFQRGVQQVELASRPPGLREEQTFKLYLLSFEQACNQDDAGCRPVDLYTPRVESDWSSLRIADEEELKNTELDCRRCHQRADRGGAQILMREVDGPWTHFLDALPPPDLQVPRPPGVTGEDLMRDFLAAKGSEPYAGIDVTQYRPSAAVVLETAAGLDQPLYFDSLQIERERWPHGASGASDDPPDPRPSPTWENGYAAFKRGDQLALPYLEARATAPNKQVQLTAAYASWRKHDPSADELPDLADIYPDDALTRARIGLETEPDASPVDALIQACGACHNDVLDQTLSRAAFNIDLSRMTRAERGRAIDRIERPRTAPGAMPPMHSRQLSDPVKARLLDYLRDLPEGEGDERLEHAAARGFSGGARPAR